MTLVKLRISQAAFSEIAAKVQAAGAREMIIGDGVINMTGVALERDPDRIIPPGIAEIDAGDLSRDAFRRIYGIDQLTTDKEGLTTDEA